MRFEVRKGVMAPGAPAAHLGLIASFWVKSAEKYVESLSGPRFVDVMAKIKPFTAIEPIRELDEVITED